MHTHLLLLSLALVGCSDVSQATCDGRNPRAGESLTLQLVTLGYADTDTGTQGDTWQDIFSDDARWQAQVAVWGDDGGLSPDFSAEAIFANAWVFGGCGEAYHYAAWRWDDTIRVRAEYDAERATCDAYFPQIDLLRVATGGLTALGWCED